MAIAMRIIQHSEKISLNTVTADHFIFQLLHRSEIVLNNGKLISEQRWFIPVDGLLAAVADRAGQHPEPAALLAVDRHGD